MILTSFEFSNMDEVFLSERMAILMYRVKQGVAMHSNGSNGSSSIQDMNDTATWIQAGKQWKCVVHTEAPASLASAASEG